MIIGITGRFYNKNNNGKIFYINKEFKDIFDKLNITLFPIVSLNNIEEVCNICDGLILSGSAIDVNPSLYGENNIDLIYDGEDKLDYALIDIFSKKNKPILGICRGIQILNVYFGGTLYQDIPNHTLKNSNGEKLMHYINIAQDSFLYKCYKDKANVTSTHHQAIKDVAGCFKVTGISEDNIIEGIEYNNIIGVQFHPEYMNDINFFDMYIKEYVKK